MKNDKCQNIPPLEVKQRVFSMINHISVIAKWRDKNILLSGRFHWLWIYAFKNMRSIMWILIMLNSFQMQKQLCCAFPHKRRTIGACCVAFHQKNAICALVTENLCSRKLRYAQLFDKNFNLHLVALAKKGHCFLSCTRERHFTIIASGW